MAELSAAETTAADPGCAPGQQAGTSGTTDADHARFDLQVALPMAPSCALDEAGLRSQLKRYRQAGRNARLIERTRRRLVVDLDQGVDSELVAHTVAVERDCCPFFALTWNPDRRRLTVAVADAAHEPALDAIAFALNIQTSD
ncbi:MAG TPA: hypothetical protein VN889_00785 [Solirubrobacteraceae bacterium]|nr:hypothetical protein [Solirubrobacteraceae bacterium]